MVSRVLYIDPSFTCTGLCLVDRENHTISLDAIDPDRETMRTYANYFRTACLVEAALSVYLERHQPNAVKLEIPPPVGQTSAGLSGLSYLLLSRILRVPGLERVELIPPNFISNQQRRHFSEFSPRSMIAREFLSMMERSQGVLSGNAGLLENNDVATAFLFYCFEKMSEGDKPFPVLPMEKGK